MTEQGPLFPTAKAVPAAGRRLGRAFRLVWRGLLALLLVLVVVHLVATVITDRMVKRELARLRAQDQPLTLEEMAPKVPEGERNAAFFYEKAFGALRLSKDEEAVEGLVDPYTESKPPLSLARKAIAANAEYFDLLDRASRTQHCAFNVSWGDPGGAFFPHYGGMRRAARLLAVRSQLHALEGQTDAAAQDCATIFRIAEHPGGDPVLIGTLVSIATHRIGLRQLEAVLSSGELSPAVARKLLDQLAAADLEQSLERGLSGERAFGISFFEAARRNPKSLEGIEDSSVQSTLRARLFRLYPTLGRPLMNLDERSYLQLWQGSRTTAETSYPARLARAAAVQTDAERLPKYRSLLTRVITPGFPRVFESAYSCAAEINAARLALLLRLYRQEHGSYPTSPAALPQPLPLDPFTGKPLGYRAEGRGFVVWSVGPDLQDDHGADVLVRERWSMYKLEGKHYDLVFRVTR
jgi:hypothetical protein